MWGVKGSLLARTKPNSSRSFSSFYQRTIVRITFKRLLLCTTAQNICVSTYKIIKTKFLSASASYTSNIYLKSLVSWLSLSRTVRQLDFDFVQGSVAHMVRLQIKTGCKASAAIVWGGQGFATLPNQVKFRCPAASALLCAQSLYQRTKPSKQIYIYICYTYYVFILVGLLHVCLCA